MSISFSPPYMDDSILNEVVDTLKSGWITTGPKTRVLEQEVAAFCGIGNVLAVNSATSAMMLVLNWFGVGQGDEVIIPAYTYCATALAVMHLGAKPVMVDVGEDFNIDPDKIGPAITEKTKAVIAVDFAGWPCKYSEIYATIAAQESRSKFKPSAPAQNALGRILLLADSAHGLGGSYKSRPLGGIADFTVFSLHAVKNVTAAEGGLICFSLPEPFDNKVIYDVLKLWSLNGQSKDAYTKSLAGNWKYDILVPGYKMSLPDVLAAIALAQLRKYKQSLWNERKRIFDFYDNHLSRFSWAICPPFHAPTESSSYHLYPLRIKDITEAERDKIIAVLSSLEISVNVHFTPLPMLSLFRNMGFEIADYPNSYAQYANEISLPIYPQLEEHSCAKIVEAIASAVASVIGQKEPTVVSSFTLTNCI